MPGNKARIQSHNSIHQPTHALLRVYWLVNPLNAQLNPFCHLLALLGAHHILHVSRIRVNPYPTNVENIYIEHKTMHSMSTIKSTAVMCHTYCFSTAKMVTRTRLYVMLHVYCPSCYNLSQNGLPGSEV